MLHFRHHKVLLLPVLLALGSRVDAQQVQVLGTFLGDSVKIGQEIPYSLTADYPQAMTVLFPDSTWHFTPFEFSRKVISPTRTVDGRSRDSVVYYLTTFEIDSVQSLSLPVFVVNARDCTSYYAAKGSVVLKQLVTKLPDSVQAAKLPLKTDTRYAAVRLLLNYPLLSIGAGVLLAVLVILWVIFGKGIIRRFRIRRLEKKHDRFLAAFNKQLDVVYRQFTPHDTEATMLIWKEYMEGLELRPFTKLTSRELLNIEQDPALAEPLQSVDRAIYGHDSQVTTPLERLRDYAEKKFRHRIARVLDE